MAAKKTAGDGYEQVVRQDPPHPLEAEVLEALEAVRGRERAIPSDATYFHSGWSLHSEQESRSASWLVEVPGETGLSSEGSESYSAVLGLFVEFRPNWPFYPEDPYNPNSLQVCQVPELESLRRVISGYRDGSGRWVPAEFGTPPYETALASYNKMLESLRREEHDRGIEALSTELSRRGIAHEVGGSTLTGRGERRPDEHKATGLNRRSTAVHVTFPDPVVRRSLKTRVQTAHDLLLAEMAAERGTDVPSLLADAARRVAARHPAAFRDDGVPTEAAGIVNLRRRPMGGLVPSQLRSDRGDGPSSLPPLDGSPS